MMSGDGPFGGIEMGGMFTTVKVRKGLARNDYKDPGWYTHPAGTVAYEWKGDASAMPQATPAPDAATSKIKPGETVLQVRKGSGHGAH
jgi:hypothetical protein